MTEKSSARVDTMGNSHDSPTASADSVPPATVTPANPLPWHVSQRNASDDPESVCGIGCAEGWIVADLWGSCVPRESEGDHFDTNLAHQNARYIVTACNAFPALVEALRAVVDADARKSLADIVAAMPAAQAALRAIEARET